MRNPANLTFFIDDCHISANIYSEGKISLFTSEKKTRRNEVEKESITITLLKELAKDVRDWSLKPEFKDFEITNYKVVLSPSWYISQAAVISKESIKPIFFSEKLIIESSDEKLAEDNDILSSSKDLLLIEKEILYASLNGYPVTNINKQKATTCNASVYYCYMSKSFKKLILDAIKTLYNPSASISFQSLAKITSQFTKKSLNDLSVLKSGNIVTINFCSYITEVVYLHNETNLNILSLPLGYKETMHSITEKNRTDRSATESLLELFINNKLRPESRDLVLELLHKLGSDWVHALMLGINQLPKTPGPNTRLFIYGIDSHQAEIAKMFSRMLPFYSNNEIPVTLFNQIML